jgi:putative ABC transport system permease protein
LTLEEKPHVVVGVMPAQWDSFARGRHPDLWFPLGEAPTPGFLGAYETIARLRPGVEREAGTSELDTIAVRALTELPQPFFGGETITTRLNRPSDRINGNTRDALLVLLAAVGLVLLVACSNVANLLLARSASRARELAVRSALGASTWRLVRALAAECLVLALAAGVAGVALGWVTLRILVQLRPNTLSTLAEVQLDATVLAFTFGVSVLTALLFGVGPALQLRSRKVGDALRHGASGVVRGGGGPRLRKLLVGAQMGMSVVLLVSGGLLLRSFVYLQNVDVGFDTQNLFTAQMTLPRARYQEAASREALSEQLSERVRASPGVAAVTESLMGPAAYLTMVGADLEIRGVTLSEADARAPRVFNQVRPDYFATVGIQLLEGRMFTADEARAGGVLLVNEAAARYFWPDGGALGGEVRWNRTWSTVIGITSNVISGQLTRSRDEPKFYLPFKHVSMPPGAALPNMAVTVRAAGDAAVAIASVRAATRELDPEIAITNVLMTETALADSLQGPRFNMALLTAFAVIALVLAAVGLAAVIGYEVTERTHEFGIRMALGAHTANVRRLAMRHGLTPALMGVVVGVVAALASTSLAQRMLYGVAPRDPLTFVGVVALLVLVAFGASWLPARRATRVDPITALRAD